MLITSSRWITELARFISSWMTVSLFTFEMIQNLKLEMSAEYQYVLLLSVENLTSLVDVYLGMMYTSKENNYTLKNMTIGEERVFVGQVNMAGDIAEDEAIEMVCGVTAVMKIFKLPLIYQFVIYKNS